MFANRLKYFSNTLLLFFMAIIINSCAGNSNREDGEDKYIDKITADTNHFIPNDVSAEPKAMNSFTKPDEEAEKAERRKFISMQIDSTYTAITLLDEAKTEITDLSPEGLTKEQRHKNSKAILLINFIQNDLTRALDASILANLKIRTNELAGITAEMQKNVNHLQEVVQRLNKAAQCISRLTNTMAFALSKGWLKPPTHKSSSATEAKAAVN